MTDVLAGIRVVEVASWTFVPSCGAILAEWGADVIKIEDPERGDPQRGLVSSGIIPPGGINFMYELPNRGKRSVGLDISTEAGRELLYRLVETADVFVTNYLPDVRRRLGIDLAQIRARNPGAIYVRGSGNGPKGPPPEKGSGRTRSEPAFPLTSLRPWRRRRPASSARPRRRPWQCLP